MTKFSPVHRMSLSLPLRFRSKHNRSSRCSPRSTLYLAAAFALTQLALHAGNLSTNRLPPVPAHPVTKIYQEMQSKWGKVSTNDLIRAAQSANVEAQFYYGFTEFQAAWMQQNAASAKLSLAFTYKTNLSTVEQNQARAKWAGVPPPELRKASEAGQRDAQWFLTDQENSTAPERARRAFEWIKRAAEQSFPLAEYQVGMRCLPFNGWNIMPEDSSAGLQWLQRAVDHGVEGAQHELAKLYLAGQIVPRDIPRAIGYLQMASEQSCVRARYELACQYSMGHGEPRSSGETPYALLKAAAAQDFNLALFDLADRYRTGLSVNRNFVRAIQLYQRALIADYSLDYGPTSHARSMLGLVDDSFQIRSPLNEDVVDFAQTLSTHLRATEQNEPEAMYQLSKYYLASPNCPRDIVSAFRWLNRAAALGHTSAIHDRDVLKAKLTPQEVAQAAKPWPSLVDDLKAIE